MSTLDNYVTANNLTIIQMYPGHIAKLGKYAGKSFNPYYAVKDNTNTEYYIAYANGDNDTECVFKFSPETLNKFNKFNDYDNPTWYYMSNGYVATTVKGKAVYFHQHMLDYYGQQSTTTTLVKGLSVDHVNQDKLDNRLSNLRLATQHEQNMNTSRVHEKGTNLPDDCLFTAADIPKYISFYPERISNGAKYGMHFVVEFRLPASKQKVSRKTTKSADKSIYYKFIQAIKIRHQLLTEHPQMHNFTDVDEILDEHLDLIMNIATMDAIPTNTAEFIDMNNLNFPDRVDITQQIAQVAKQVDDTHIEQQKQKRIARETERGPCPDCGNELVLKTLSRHQKLYCAARVLTDEQKAEIDAKKHDRYARVSRTKILTLDRKLTDEDILVIRESYYQGMSNQSLATKFNVSRQYISDVVSGKVKLKQLVEVGIL